MSEEIIAQKDELCSSCGAEIAAGAVCYVKDDDIFCQECQISYLKDTI
jgi:hypothetical protein